MVAYREEWQDMSEYVIHLTKDEDGPPSAYQQMLSILYTRTLKPGNTFGCARSEAPNAEETQSAVCFSEVPLHLLLRLVNRRKTKHGIGFRKEFVRSNGVNPIWYVEKGSAQQRAIEHLKSAAAHDPGNPTWELTPLIDYPGEYGSTRYRFEWEREWRHVGCFSFHQSDVTFLLMPEDLHGAARGFFADAKQENTGPAYDCPFIDPDWSAERIRTALQPPAF